MPVFPFPYDHGSAAFLSDACVVLNSDGVFIEPRTMDCHLPSAFWLTPDELRACNWRRIVNSRFMKNLGYDDILIRVSIYGVDLSDHIRGVKTVKMEEYCGRYLHAFKRLSPRIKWLAAYSRLKEERRLALAMVNHQRLGADSELRVLGVDLVSTISRFF